MAGRTRVALSDTNQAPITNDPTGLFEAFICGLENLGATLPARGPQPYAHRAPAGDTRLKEFCALKPERFDGLGEPWKAEQWLREKENIFDAMDCSATERRRLAMFQIMYVAANWWESVKATIGEDAV